MKIEFDVKLYAKDLYLFNMYQAYKGMQGILSLVLPAFIFWQAYVNWDKVSRETSLLNIGIGVLFLAYIPITLLMRANKVVKKDRVLSKPLHYEFTEESIRVTQGEESAEFVWDNIYRMVTLRGLVLIYTNRINAYIIEKKQIADQYEDLAKLANAKLEKHRIKMK